MTPFRDGFHATDDEGRSNRGLQSHQRPAPVAQHPAAVADAVSLCHLDEKCINYWLTFDLASPMIEMWEGLLNGIVLSSEILYAVLLPMLAAPRAAVIAAAGEGGAARLGAASGKGGAATGAGVGAAGAGVGAAESSTGFSPPKPYLNNRGQLTNGKYTIDQRAMVPHNNGSTVSGKSQFLSSVDAETAVLDAASYADRYHLWNGSKAKVLVRNGPVGVVGKSGELTDWINVYRTRTGFIHGAPGNAP